MTEPLDDRAVDVVKALQHPGDVLIKAGAGPLVVSRGRLAVDVGPPPDGTDEVANLLRDLRDLRSRYLASQYQDVVQLALATARKVVGDALDLDPARVEALARRALDEVDGARVLTLRVSTQAFEAVGPDRLSALTDARVTVEADPGLTLGDVVIDTDIGRVDARIDVQFDRLLDHLTTTPHDD